MKLGIQLYSVREQLEKDFCGTLAALQTMGFEGVEFAGQYGGLPPGETAAALDAVGLTCCGLHADPASLMDPENPVYAYAAALHTPFITVSCCGRDQLQHWNATIATLARVATVVRSMGYRFTYHNHAPELEVRDGQTLLDALYAETPPSAVEAELDTAWVYAGGADPIETIRRHANRLPQVHAKNYSREAGALREIGRGDLDFGPIVAAARTAGVVWLIYELDVSSIDDSLASARESSIRLRQWIGGVGR